MVHRVDHQARRQALAEAVWAVIQSSGVEGLTLRKVAGEAGWTTGAVQYYFPARSGLLEYAFRLVQQRTLDRIAARAADTDDDAAARVAFEQVLPISADIQREAEVWFSFLGIALGNDPLRTVGRVGQNSVIEAIAGQVSRSQSTGRVAAHLEPTAVAVEGMALADGLCINAMYGPTPVPSEVPSVFRRWFSSLH